MEIKVNQDKCIGCGNCVGLTESKVFDFNEEGLADCILKEIPSDLEDITKEAKSQCPTDAIEEK